MLKVLWGFFDNPSRAESQLLSELLRGVPELPEWSSAVQPVLTRLLTSSQIHRPMVGRVLAMPVFNALALPHKSIVLAESLVEFCRYERDQIAFVLAHEAAHILLGHAGKRSRANALVTVMRTANPLVGMGIRMLFDRAFSREQEFEADRLGVTLCARAGYGPQGAIAFFTRLGALDNSTGVLAQFLSTHPPLQERIEQLQGVAS